jgi:hypothetical protein
LRPGGGGGKSRLFVPRFSSSSSFDLTNGGSEETPFPVKVNTLKNPLFLFNLVSQFEFKRGLDSFP